MGMLTRQARVFNLRLTIVTAFLGFVFQWAIAFADAWDIQTIDTEGDVGQYTSLALDELGFPHISYFDDTNNDLKYAYLDEVGWHIQTVDFEGSVGFYASLALDAEGFPHIGYGGNGALNYAYQDSNGWHVDQITGQGGTGASLVLDPSGFPHIGHSGFYSYQDTSGWTHESVPDVTDPGIGNDLALDAAGGPHLTFVSYGYNDWLMRYASKPEGSWQTEIVDAEPTAGAGCSLIMDAYHVLHVSYFTVGLYWNVKYARKDDSGWLTQIVDQNNWGSYDDCWTSLALDSEGSPHFCYWRQGNLVIQHWDGSWWYLEIVDTEGDVGTFSSMALDASDRPHISYYDDTNGDLKYATFVPAPMELTGSLQDGQLRLTWTPVWGVARYWVFGTAGLPWFVPDLSPPTYVNRVAVVPGGTTTWSSTNGIGDPNANWTYLVIAMENTNTELARSNRAGEHDYDTDAP